MICRLASAMAERGHQVHLVSLDNPEQNTCLYTLDARVTWHRLGRQSGLSGKIDRVKKLISLLQSHKIDVFTGFVMSGDKTIYCATKLAGVCLVVAERNAPSMYHMKYSRWQRFLAFAFMHLADVICVQNKAFISGYWATLRSKILTVPNPVSKQQLSSTPEAPNAKGRFTLLYVGRLENQQKGVNLLLTAFHRIAHEYPDWDLRIIGEGPDQNSLASTIQTLALENRVQFLPKDQDLRSAYCDGNAFVIPSKWEGFPNALAEAMSHGLPAIGFAEALGVANLITDRTGWSAKGEMTASSLSDALRLAMSQGEERRRRGLNAIRTMQTFCPNKQFDRWEHVFTKCMKKAVR